MTKTKIAKTKPVAGRKKAPATKKIAPAPASTAETAEGPPKAEPKGKIGILIALLEHSEGATIESMMAATGWQAHSVRGAISGSIKKALGREVTSAKTEAGRVYRIVAHEF
jgi:hypothetical protein